MASAKTGPAITAKAAKKAAAKKVATKRMGRPPRAGAEGAATHTVIVRLTDAEYARLSRLAKTSGSTLSAVLRDAALSIDEKA